MHCNALPSTPEHDAPFQTAFSPEFACLSGSNQFSILNGGAFVPKTYLPDVAEYLITQESIFNCMLDQ